MDLNKGMKKILPFNNSVESGLRILTILNECFPATFDIHTLVYLDYLIVHSGDFEDSLESLHPAVPYRDGEIFVRSSIIERGLKLFTSKGLVVKMYNEVGIEYKASEKSTPFIENLEEEYIIKLQERAKWLRRNFVNFSSERLKEMLSPKLEAARREFNIELLQ